MKRTTALFVALAAILCGCSKEAGFSVYDLTCEGLDEPIAIDSATPHFSWKIQADEPMAQTGREIQVASSRKLLLKDQADLWNIGKVTTDGQIMVPYSGAPLSSRQLCWWRVRVWDDKGNVSAWSEPQRFAVGIIGEDIIDGSFIGMASDNGAAPLLRQTFSVKKAGQTAFLHVNSLGYHEAYINGEPVSDAVLSPAVSQMDKRSLINTYDVTDLLRAGDNEIVLWTAQGWYKPGAFGLDADGPLVRAELDVLTRDGWERITGTDSDWQAAESGYSDFNPRNRNIFGEVIDARGVPASLKSEDLDRLEWKNVTVKDITIPATPQMCEPCREQEAICGQSVVQDGEGTWIVDLGRVGNGLLEATVSAPAGTSVKVSVFDEDQFSNWYPDFGSYELITSGAADGDRFVGKFNTNVFRYVRFEGLGKAPDPASVKVRRVRTDYAEAASFECSDPDIQAIHDMIRYTMQNLAFAGDMVDCANLERLGYGGDGNASTLSLQTMFDVAPLYVNWLTAWNDAIQPDGGLPHTAPEPWSAGGGPYWCSFIVQAPWRTYMSYGDTRMMERSYDNMKLWLTYVDRYTGTDGILRRWPDTGYRGWYLGDWLAPRGTDVNDPESIDLVNNCAIAQVYKELSEIAGTLGKESESRLYTQLLETKRSNIHGKFYHPATGTYGSGSQLDMAYPLLVGAVPEDLRAAVTEKLLERTQTVYNGHLGVGLVGVPVLTEWATLYHQPDFIYSMLKKRDYPGYLYMIDNGATGTWEDWDNPRSHFHNCYNGIGSWFYQALGGIIPLEPGYRKVLIDPQMPEGIKWVNVTKETPYGTITVKWDNSNGQADVQIEAPVGVEVVRP